MKTVYNKYFVPFIVGVAAGLLSCLIPEHFRFAAGMLFAAFVFLPICKAIEIP